MSGRDCDRTCDEATPDAAKKAPDHTGSIIGKEETDPVLAERVPHDTLTQNDLALEWRGAR